MGRKSKKEDDAGEHGIRHACCRTRAALEAGVRRLMAESSPEEQSGGKKGVQWAERIKATARICTSRPMKS